MGRGKRQRREREMEEEAANELTHSKNMSLILRNLLNTNELTHSKDMSLILRNLSKTTYNQNHETGFIKKMK